MTAIQTLLKRKPYLVWYVADTNKLSHKSILEHILNYGDWGDYLTTERSLGLKTTSALFHELKNGKRTNLRPQTIHYFTNYFHKYA